MASKQEIHGGLDCGFTVAAFLKGVVFIWFFGVLAQTVQTGRAFLLQKNIFVVWCCETKKAVYLCGIVY